MLVSACRLATRLTLPPRSSQLMYNALLTEPSPLSKQTVSDDEPRLSLPYEKLIAVKPSANPSVALCPKSFPVIALVWPIPPVKVTSLEARSNSADGFDDR